MYLYRTKLGLKIIDDIAKKWPRTLRFLSFISVGVGYILMVIMVYFLLRIVWIYYKFPAVVQAVKVPPLMPLVPYLPEIFKIDFLPPFYFTYWIIIIAIIAIFHEMAHGIYARYYNINVKSTGFGFLGPFLAAFVEPDEKEMQKKGIYPQLTILSAGTFANVLTAIFFIIVLILYFNLAFAPAGVQFSTYSFTAINITQINSIDNSILTDSEYFSVLDSLENGLQTKDVIEIELKDGSNYLADKLILQNQVSDVERDFILVYHDAPAIRNKLSGAITEIDGEEITSREDLQLILDRHSSGDNIEIKIKSDFDNESFVNIVLGEHPLNKEKPFLGISFSQPQYRGIIGNIMSLSSMFKDPNVYYEPVVDGLSIFIYNLLWWIILISVSVALVNMLPLGIFDGGRFFYLSVLALTKSEKVAKKSFVISTYFFILLFLLLMIFWFISIL